MRSWRGCCFFVLQKREHIARCLSKIVFVGNFSIGERVGGTLYGHGVSRGFDCKYEALVVAVIIQEGLYVIDFSNMWREGSVLGGGFMDKYFLTRK